jgi:hypothetical protein
MPRVNNKRKNSKNISEQITKKIKQEEQVETNDDDPLCCMNVLGEDPPRGRHHPNWLEVVPRSVQIQRKMWLDLPENADLKAKTLKMVYPNGF